jgi:putative ABC transport system permease protein
VLREKTVDLMKNGSEFRGSFVARHIKAPFRSFGIMTKFRITVAFNSIWKLIILSVMVSLSISALVFGINTYGKFSDAEQKTFASRNYSYAIDLYSPTDQGGQYIPVNADISGETGFVQSNDNTSWIPSIYFDSHSQTAGDLSYKNVFGEASPETKNDEFFGIPKVYYNETYDIYDAATLSTGKIEESFVSEDGKTTHASILYPMMSDAIGETNDLMYLKNHSMFKTGLDFTVGAFGMTSNPWSIAVSLMPENSKNMADARTVQMIQALGEATS